MSASEIAEEPPYWGTVSWQLAHENEPDEFTSVHPAFRNLVGDLPPKSSWVPGSCRRPVLLVGRRQPQTSVEEAAPEGEATGKDLDRAGHVGVMSGDEEAGFRVLFDDHFADLWRFARRRVGSASDADDVVAETFAVAWRRRDALPGGHDTRLWLFGVARQVLANQRRGERRRLRLHLRLVATRVNDAAASPEPGVVLKAVFGALSDSERDVLIMRCWDGLAVHEIATLLGCTPNAASLRLHKARRRLAEMLAQKDPAAAGQVAGDPVPGKDRRHA